MIEFLLCILKIGMVLFIVESFNREIIDPLSQGKGASYFPNTKKFLFGKKDKIRKS